MSREEQSREEYALRTNTVPALERAARWNRPGIDLETPRISASGNVLPLQQHTGNTSNGASAQDRSRIRGFTSKVTVSNESVMILAADPERKFLFFQNEDAVGYVRIAFGVAATLETGVRLAPGGGGILLDNHVPTGAVFVIGSVPANPNLTMVVA